MERKTFLKIGLGLAFSEIAYMGAMFGLLFLLPKIVFDDFIPGIRSAVLNLIYTAALYIVMLFVLWVFVRSVPAAPKKPKQKLSLKMFFALMMICFGFGYLLALGGGFIDDLFKSLIRILFDRVYLFPEPGSYVAPDKTTVEFISSSIITVIYAPVFEELIFRKVLLDKLRPFGDVTAILFTGFAFGLTHMNFGQFFFATAVGFVFGYVMIKTNRLIYPILMHFAYNSFSAFVFPFMKWVDKKIGLVVAMLVLSGFLYSMMVIGPSVFFTNLKKIKLDRPEYRFSRPLGGKMIFLNAGTIIYLVVISLVFVYVALTNALIGA